MTTALALAALLLAIVEQVGARGRSILGWAVALLALIFLLDLLGLPG